MANKRFVATKVEVEGREETRIVELPEFEPAPWTADVPMDVVGQCVPRMDALEKVTGLATFTTDVKRPGMLYAAIVRSPIANGRVKSLDLAPSLAMPGARAVLLREEVDGLRYDSGQLFDHVIRFAGQPLAAVAAESQEAANRAALAAIVQVEADAHAVTSRAALRQNAPKIRSHGNTSKHSPRVHARGDVDAAMAQADVVIRREFRTPCALHTAMEPHGAVAEWRGDMLTVWESTQGIFNTRSDLAEAFGLKLTQVRVIKEHMGGGFGAKNGAHASTYIAAALARKTGLPVRCVLDREGEQVDSGNRSSTTQRVALAARRDGTLTAIIMESEIAMGVGGWFASPAKICHELYSCPNVRTTEVFVYTNTGAMASFRAPGHVEGAFGLECSMDALARELRMDPLDLRMRNYASHDQEKDRRYSDKRLDECYRQGAQRFGWKSPLSTSSARSARLRRGKGMASISWGAGGGPPSYATVRVNQDGTAEVLTGSQDLGTGARTVFAQIAAEALGADINHVRTILGDTERLPYTGNSWGSQTTASVGPAVRMAAEDAKTRLLEAAAQILRIPAEQLEARESFVRMKGAADPTSQTPSLSFQQITEKLGDVMIIGQGSRGPNPDKTALFAFGAQFAEVEVDVETGHVRVIRLVAAHDSGRIINPRLAESQLEGGMLQGLGFALFEERVLDESLGLPLNPTMHDYKIPTMSDLPTIEAFFVPGSDTVANHTGAKGLAEPPIIGIAPAIANAVADAIGAEILELPITPWRVLAALERSR
ncbi:MAG TPA: xanthine dehydrogenase family protein molybdopterin-binding subunit [Gemmatimonadaceae bacterium]|nr:xanthine dehydrogenase family protein molybdopterin-binding subunit [Gemmatimonadaceae bacterium]